MSGAYRGRGRGILVAGLTGWPVAGLVAAAFVALSGSCSAAGGFPPTVAPELRAAAEARRPVRIRFDEDRVTCYVSVGVSSVDARALSCLRDP